MSPKTYTCHLRCHHWHQCGFVRVFQLIRGFVPFNNLIVSDQEVRSRARFNIIIVNCILKLVAFKISNAMMVMLP